MWGLVSHLVGKGAEFIIWENLMASSLQLGQGLRDHAKTRCQMSDVSAKLDAINGTVVDLLRWLGSTQRGEDAWKTRLEVAEWENQLVNMSVEVQARG
ncbi:hypothetical protein DPEC_G00271470 [Dallia pectoralis]|uniref:Uncharacterized protein n=1 Tax=Dallia pectoralis TaxID=75939 RepID=A0ACC2FPV1_DALPE|nr:hypothetical protein DPEC_G00271470 [Dallia pectoralis]